LKCELKGDRAFARAVKSLTDAELIRLVRGLNSVDRAVLAHNTSPKASK
jgi:hypothetical protein